MGRFLQDGFLGARASGGGGITWVNLSALASGHADAADNDPSSQHASFASDATGTTIAVQNSVLTAGVQTGALYIIDDWANIFADWAEDGTKQLLVHGTVVTSAPDSKSYWMGACLIEATDLNEAAAIVYRRNTTTDQISSLRLSASGALSSPCPGVGWLMSVSMGSGSDVGAAIPSTDSVILIQENNLNAGYRLAFAAGCASTADDGPHSAKILWKAALVDTVPS